MVSMGHISSLIYGLKPAMIMVVIQVASAGVNVFYKLASNDGMSLKVLVVYRLIFATAFMVPLALIFERNKRPKLTWIVLFQAFLTGLFGGSLSQNLYLESLSLTSATFVSAIANLVPAITFILATSFGLEKLGLATSAGMAKVLGTLIGIGGAMVLTFYKGVEIDIWSTHVNLLSHGRHVASSPSANSGGRVLGALLAVASSFSTALWFVIQAKMSERYPRHYSSIALMSLMGSIQAVLFALCMDKDWNQWKLGWNIRLLTAAYSGVVGTGLTVTLMAWCVRMRGPLFASVFSPRMLVLVALAGSLLLDENLYLGSILGAIFIILGLYVVLWGKRKEMKKKTQLVPSTIAGEHESIEIVITSSTNSSFDNITDKDISKEYEVKEENDKEDRK